MKARTKITTISGIITGALSVILISAAGEKNETYSSINNIQDVKYIRDLPTKKNEAFKTGEVLTYRLHYGAIDAAIATLEVKPELEKFANRECYHIVGTGVSRGSFDWFFKVRDKYETHIDKNALVPWVFNRNCLEGGYAIHQNYIFNHYSNKVDVGGGETFPISEGTQDMISAFYSARNVDFSNAKEGDIFALTCFIDKETWPLKIKFVGKETIKSDIGKIRCLKFRPIVQKGRVFKKEEDLTIWISDDKNHIPIRGQAKILIGSVRMDLTGVKNLANDMAKVD
ncbi:MAG TPA: DUF3108 domain-containing protein [Bacteroidia bacterium]